MSAVNDVIDEAFREIAAGANTIPPEAGETFYNSAVARYCRAQYINVTDDGNNRGHADLKIESTCKKFVWLGEGKLWTRPIWALKGIMQLLTRYSTGLEAGYGLLLYFRQDGMVKRLQDWSTYLGRLRICVGTSPRGAGDFASDHNHSAGVQVTIRHVGLNMYFDPKDDNDSVSSTAKATK